MKYRDIFETSKDDVRAIMLDRLRLAGDTRSQAAVQSVAEAFALADWMDALRYAASRS
jgi:gamma-glutamyl phosphate reductase